MITSIKVLFQNVLTVDYYKTHELVMIALAHRVRIVPHTLQLISHDLILKQALSESSNIERHKQVE